MKQGLWYECSECKHKQFSYEPLTCGECGNGNLFYNIKTKEITEDLVQDLHKIFEKNGFWIVDDIEDGRYMEINTKDKTVLTMPLFRDIFNLFSEKIKEGGSSIGF